MKTCPWELRWETIHPFYRMEQLFIGHKHHLVLGSDYSMLLGICKNDVMSMHYPKADIRRKEREALTILYNKNLMNDYFFVTTKNYEDLISLINRTVDQLNSISNENLWINYQEIMKHLQFLLSSYDLSRPEFGVHAGSEIKNYLANRLPDKAINNAFSALTTSFEPSILDEEEHHLLKIASAHKKEKRRLLKIHQQMYGWMGTAEQETPWMIDYYINQLKTESGKDIKDRIARKSKLAEEQKELEKELNPPENLRYLIQLIRKLAHLRLLIRLKWIESGYLLDKIFEKISNANSVPKLALKRYRLKELGNLLNDRKTVDVSERGYYAFLLRKGKIHLYEGKSVDRLQDRELPKINYNSINEIKGMVASPGYAKGRVKIINSLSKDQYKEILSMQKGDILVTGMTRPHLMMAIRKASAIITDEGGITSHAAIVSRELAIPCIIGTKIATKVLKDRGTVEVDANKGIIRKL